MGTTRRAEPRWILGVLCLGFVGASRAQTYDPQPGLNATCAQATTDLTLDVFERNHPAIPLQDKADTDLAVGPCHVVTCSNFGVRSNAKQVSLEALERFLAMGVFSSSDDHFWPPTTTTPPSTPPPPYYSHAFDPQVVYDPYSGRYGASAAMVERHAFPSGGSPPDHWYLVLAVSKSEDPNPSGTEPAWWFYRFECTQIVAAVSNIDQPKLAVDSDNFYILADSITFSEALVLTLPKDDYLDGSADKNVVLGVGDVREIEDRWPTLAVRFGLDDGTPQYAINDGFGLGVEHNDNESSSFITLYAIDREGEVLDSFAVTSLPTYTQNNTAPQDDSSSTPPIVTDSGFFVSAVYWPGAEGDGSLWAVHTVRHDLTQSDLSYIRWYEFTMNGWPAGTAEPELRQSGELELPEGYYGYFPSIAVDSLGNAAITFNVSGEEKRISVWQAFRCHNDSLNTFREPFEIKAGAAIYDNTSGPTQGWGDYTGTGSDPVAGGVFWAHAQYPFGEGTTNVWRSVLSRTDLSCGLDADGDGAATAGDLAAFLQAYAAGSSRADYSADGVLTIQDMTAFAIDLAGP
ncbi:MAG: hypothetical protein IT437_13045 [Phycisphaerales bacterium]|nr:hypothetical protein [Phycisphaerales bacterium]